MDRAAHPVDRGRRAARSAPLILDCACGFAERWPWPLGVSFEPGRCTCPRCGDQLRPRPPELDATSAAAAYAAWSRDVDG